MNVLARLMPKPAVRFFLKSLWYQPGLQDALRFHVQPYRYDSAIPTRFDLDLEKLRRRRCLPGVRLDTDRHLRLLKQLLPYAVEIADLPVEPDGKAEFWFRNSAYQDLDAVVLYCMVRHYKPRRLIEAGCGFSSRVISMAARRNAAEGFPVDCLFIEPYPTDRILRERLAGPLLEEKIEAVPLERFHALEAGDFLFIDTSHVVKAQSDCCFEYLELIPSLRPGVIVHVHDIFTPYDYPEEWLLKNLFAFNEQYALECLLTGGRLMEVLLPLYQLCREQPAALAPFFPGPPLRSAAFWLQTGQPAEVDAAGRVSTPSQKEKP
jgi:predicted O-methyltransferase YrrM